MATEEQRKIDRFIDGHESIKGLKRPLIIIGTLFVVLIIVVASWLNYLKPINEKYNGDLITAKENFKTTLIEDWVEGTNILNPPKGVLKIVNYKSPIGILPAYISPDPKDNKKHPAIIWIIGGFGNSLESTPWEKAPKENNQSAAIFRQKGIVTMYPSFRGGNNNPGYQEYFLGEVEDIIAAAKYLSSLPYVDTERIYLGGHSTGGTLALLTAESTKFLFRAIFSIDPIDNVEEYGVVVPFDTSNKNEWIIRSPINWLSSIKSETFVLSGYEMDEENELDAVSLWSLKEENKNNKVHFTLIKGWNHFDILEPACEVISDKILADTGKKTNITNITLKADDIDW